MSDAYVDACLSGNLKLLKKMTPPNIDIISIFYNVCELGYVHIAKWILRTTSNYSEYLLIVCEFGYFDLVEIILKHNLDLNYAFVTACKYGHLDIAKLIYSTITNKSFINRTFINKAFENACLYGYVQVAQWLYDKEPTWYYIHIFSNVCRNGHLSMLKWLIKKIVWVPGSVLSIACITGHLKIVKWLFSDDVDVLLKCEFTLSDVINAFQLAYTSGKLKIIKWFMKFDPYLIKSINPYHFQLSWEYENIVRWSLYQPLDFQLDYNLINFINDFYVNIPINIKRILIEHNLVNPSRLNKPDLIYYLSITNNVVPTDFTTEFTDLPARKRGSRTKPAIVK